MTKRIAGAALAAAALSFCAVGQANASTFTITSSSVTGADGVIFFSLSGSANGNLFGNTSGKLSTFKYNEEEQASNYLDFISTTFTDPNATFSTSGTMSTPNWLGTLNSVNITVSDPSLTFVVSSTDGSSTSETGYSFTFTLYQQLDPDMQNPEYTTGSNGTILGSVYSPSDSNATFSLTTVPLPASAPMFGAALLALGAVGYGLKRKGAAMA